MQEAYCRYFRRYRTRNMPETAAINRKKTLRGPADTAALFITLALVVFGLIMLFSASSARALYMFGDSYYYIKNQFVYAVIGTVMMLGISFVDYHILKPLAWVIYIGSEILLAATLAMPAINSAKRWIVVGSHTFQASEISKFAVICLFALLISSHPELMKNFRYGFLLFMLILGSIVVILYKQPHMSCAILIMIIGCAMMLVGGTKIKWFVLTGIPLLAGGYAVISATDKLDYIGERIGIWLDPFTGWPKDGHQIRQSLIAIGSGGLTGLGLGNSRQKHMYLPESQDDFIFSVIVEEIGFIGAVFVIILFVLLLIRGVRIAVHCRDSFGSMLAIGITVQISAQALLNIAVVSNSFPNTGISLPFFSQGGTSLVMLLCETGVLLSVSRYNDFDTEDGETQ